MEGASLINTMKTVYIMWLREVKKFFRSRSRIIGALGQPILFLLAFGYGFGAVFQAAGQGDYIQFLAPGIIGMTIIFGSIFNGMAVIWDRQFGFLKETLVAPVSRIHIMLGRTLGGATVEVCCEECAQSLREARDAAGNTTTASSLTVTVNNGTPAIPTGAFLGQYWNLPAPISAPSIPSTSPTQTRTDTTINFDWGSGAPMTGSVAAGFVVRWQGNWSFPTASSEQFSVTADDGIRIFLDGTLLINQWKDQAPTTYTATTAVTSGTHLVMVEYYENAGGAVAKVTWQAVPSGDTTAPTVSLTAPITGAAVSGSAVTVSATASDTVAVPTPMASSFRTRDSLPIHAFRASLMVCP